jgi:hypothetical protein
MVFFSNLYQNGTLCPGSVASYLLFFYCRSYRRSCYIPLSGQGRESEGETAPSAAHHTAQAAHAAESASAAPAFGHLLHHFLHLGELLDKAVDLCHAVA